MDAKTKSQNESAPRTRADHAAMLDAARRAYAGNQQRFQQMLPDLLKISGHSELSSGPPHRSIAHAFRYSTSDQAIESELRTLTVEVLLQQAAAYLDRVLADNTTYRQLVVEQTNLRLDIEEYQALDAINEQERESGLFYIPYWEASASVASDGAVKQATTDLADWVHSQAPAQAQYAAWSTENGQQPIATGWENKLSKHTVRLYGGFTPDPKDVPKGAQASDGNIIGGIISYAISNYSLTFQEKQLRSQVTPGEQRAPFLGKKRDYYYADIGFRERRRIAAHTKLIEKLEAIRSKGGPLNYADRIKAIEERAAADLKQAYARMIVLKRGLHIVYGESAPDLPYVPQDISQPLESSFVDNSIMWIRTVAAKLQLLAGRDQEFVYPVSLRNVLGWDEFRSGSRERSWQITVDASAFPNLRFVRLRAISASVKGGCNDPLSFVVKAPSDTVFIHAHDSLVPFRQRIDDCWLGRVRCNTSVQGSDVCGSKTLFNASPFGTWIVRPAPGVNTNDIEDLQLNFYLAAQVQR